MHHCHFVEWLSYISGVTQHPAAQTYVRETQDGVKNLQQVETIAMTTQDLLKLNNPSYLTEGKKRKETPRTSGLNLHVTFGGRWKQTFD